MAPLKTDCAAVGESGGGVGGPSTVWLIMTMSLNVKLF